MDVRWHLVDTHCLKCLASIKTQRHYVDRFLPSSPSLGEGQHAARREIEMQVKSFDFVGFVLLTVVNSRAYEEK